MSNPTQVLYSEEVNRWFNQLNNREQDDFMFNVRLLQEFGVRLKFPYSSSIKGSKRIALRELRYTSLKQEIRVLYAFDPHRNAVLLVAGNKGGDKRWYITAIATAEEAYERYKRETEDE